MTTHNQDAEKQGYRKSTTRRDRRKFGMAKLIAGAVLTGGLLVVSCGSSGTMNSSPNTAAYYADPSKKPYGKKIEKDKEKIEKWEDHAFVIYKKQSTFMDMEKRMEDMLSERMEVASLAEELPDLMKDLNKDQRGLFLTITSTMLDNPKKLSNFVKRSVLMNDMLKTGAEPSSVLGFEKDIMLEPIEKDTQAAKAYNKIIEELEGDALGQAMLLTFLNMEGQENKSIPAALFIKDHYVDKPIEKEVLNNVSKAIFPLLKTTELEQKPPLEKFRELMSEDTSLLNEREKVLFLNITSRLNDIERKYAISFVDSFYEAVKDPQTVGMIYDTEMEMLQGLWGFPFQEMLDSVLERAEDGRDYTTPEKLMIATLFHYSFLEAFQVNPPMGKSFLARLLETAGKGFARGSAHAEASQIRSQEYIAMGAALNWGGAETDILTRTKNLLFTPLIYGASVALSDTVTFAAQYFINWIVKVINPTELELVTKLSFHAMGGKAKKSTLNDLYSLMEFGAGIGILGDKYKDVDERMKIKKALNNIRKGITNGTVNVDEHPLIVAELYRLMNICVVSSAQQPGVNWYQVFDTVLGDTLEAIEGGAIKNEEDMVDFTNVMDFVARKRLYHLGDVAEAIRKAYHKTKYPLSQVLENAAELASEKKKITKGTLKKPHKAKPVFD
jgi:hypothetical protein